MTADPYTLSELPGVIAEWKNFIALRRNVGARVTAKKFAELERLLATFEAMAEDAERYHTVRKNAVVLPVYDDGEPGWVITIPTDVNTDAADNETWNVRFDLSVDMYRAIDAARKGQP